MRCKCGKIVYYGVYCVSCYKKILKEDHGEYYNDLYREELEIQEEINRNLPEAKHKSFRKYDREVRELTEDNFTRNKQLFEGSEKRGFTDHHLDHVVSVRYCYDHCISVELAACLDNLRIIPYQENLLKGNKLDPSLNNAILQVKGS